MIKLTVCLDSEKTEIENALSAVNQSIPFFFITLLTLKAKAESGFFGDLRVLVPRTE